MADSISYESPIWELTPTELNVAYLSLTLTKKEIATRLAMTESTAGTHLTNTFDKLGLSAYPDDQKRIRLKEDFGRSIEKIVAEVDEDYQGKYRQRRKEALETKADKLKQQQRGGTGSTEGRIDERPPAPRPVDRWREIAGLIFGAFLVIFGFCLFILIALNNMRPNNPPPENTPTPTFAYTQTPEISPTPVPLPIREDFDKQISDLWRTIGDPLIVDNVERGKFSGVLTNRYGETSTLLTGNVAWNNYVVNLRATGSYVSYYEDHIEIGVRVISLNNMIVVDCDLVGDCTWVIYAEGFEDRLPSTERLDLAQGMEIVVDGNTITVASGATGFSSAGNSDGKMRLEIPSKYQDKFTGGGVMLRTRSIVEVDYIEIDPLP